MAIYVEFTNRITKKIEEFQKKYGSSRTFIANRIGISRQSLNALETSKNPTIIMLIKIATVLECEVHDLYDIRVSEQLDFLNEEE